MMRRDLRCDRKAVGLGPPDHLDCPRCGQVQEVHGRAGEPHQREVPREHHLLGQRVLARDPEAARPGTFVHVTARC